MELPRGLGSELATAGVLRNFPPFRLFTGKLRGRAQGPVSDRRCAADRLPARRRGRGRFIVATAEAAGHDVLAVTATGERALGIAARSQPEVVIVDTHLAGEMDGIETARRLRNRFRCAVIFHTAHADTEHRARMMAIDNAAIVPKPAKFARLVEAVSAAPGVSH